MGKFEKDFANYTMVSAPKIPDDFFYVDQKQNDQEQNFNPIQEALETPIISSYSSVQEDPINQELQKKQGIKKSVVKRAKSTTKNFNTYKGYSQFEKAFQEATKIDPTVAQRKEFFIRTAQRESNFNSSIQNGQGAPCYGYFQIHSNNIKKLSGLSLDQFRSDPVAQILVANRLYDENLKWLKTSGMYDLGTKKGYSEGALMSGCWLGPGALRTYLLGKGDPSDKHWSKDKKTGVSVSELLNGWMNKKY